MVCVTAKRQQVPSQTQLHHAVVRLHHPPEPLGHVNLQIRLMKGTSHRRDEKLAGSVGNMLLRYAGQESEYVLAAAIDPA